MRGLDVTILTGDTCIYAVTFNCRQDVVDFIDAAKEQLNVENTGWFERSVDHMLAYYEKQNKNLALTVGNKWHLRMEWCYDEWYSENGYNVINIDELRCDDSFEIAEDLSALFA